MKTTSAFEYPTSGTPWRMSAAVFATFVFVGRLSSAPTYPELTNAVRPMEEGIPQVAVLRLRALLARDLGPEERLETMARLGEALLAAGETESALKVLQDPALPATPGTLFFRAQAFASLGRWEEALLQYRQVASGIASPFHSRALLGEAQTLRALKRPDEALQVFGLLLSDPRTKDQAELRSVELLLEKGDSAGARRLLDKTRPTALQDKKEKRFLQGRLEALLNHRERALELFQTILRRPEGASRAVLIATLCAVAETSLRLKTPETGDDPLEDFVEHHPTDPELPTIFMKLDQLYRAEQNTLRSGVTTMGQRHRAASSRTGPMVSGQKRSSRRASRKCPADFRGAASLSPIPAGAGWRSLRVCAT